MSINTENKILVSTIAFDKKGEELYDTSDEMEVTDTTDTEAEIAIDHVRGERIYIRFNVADLMRVIHAYGRKRE